MKILGVTGGIASGKSVVMTMLSELGAPTLSADALAHTLLAPGTALTGAVIAEFPDAADAHSPETIDRARLARQIFADPAARRRLESLTHPSIVAALRERFDAWRLLSSPRAGAGEIPLLFEVGLESLVDQILVVACEEKTQIARLMERDRLDQDEALRRLSAQWPLSEKIARASFVIHTDDGLDATRRQVQLLWDGLQV